MNASPGPDGRFDFGQLNSHAVGSLMKEAVRRAMVSIRLQRTSFEVQPKKVGADGRRDFVTSADRLAQEVFVRLLRRWFPDYGIVAEEEELRVACEHPCHDLWFSVDPLDGTHAFIRRQNFGIGTMLALMGDGQVLGAYVGDVMRQEIFAARPGDDRVHLIRELGSVETLVPDRVTPLREQWLLLGAHHLKQRDLALPMVAGERPLFSGLEMTTGSIGVAFSRLWQGEVGGALIGPFARATAWDLYPIYGISERLGFLFFELHAEEVRPWIPIVDREGVPMPHPILAIHESQVSDFLGWWNARASA